MGRTISNPICLMLFVVSLVFGACSHPVDESWIDNNSTDFHGTSTLNCAECHDLSVDCSSCHFGALGDKSPSEWVHGTNLHGQLVASGPVCNRCHTLSRSYGNGPGTCHDCHGLPVSHDTGEPWLNKSNPDFHGSSELSCSDCHDLVADCSECHFGALGDKSPSEWVHGTDSHEQLESGGPVCNTCHELNRSFGNGPDACHDCHGLPVSHDTGEPWLNKSNPDFHGSSELNCSDCHNLPVDCSSCHFGVLGDKSPSEWVHGTDSHEQLESSGPVCNRCHGLNRSYGNGPEACHDCHGLPVFHDTGEPWLNKSNADFHGTSTLNCAECHDLSVDCSSCHFGALGDKSPSEWVHGTDSHEQLESSGPVCNTCHALSRSYGNGPGACHDCHED